MKDLRNQLQQLGLDSTGKKAELVHRLAQAQVHGKSSNERENCAAIVACTTDTALSGTIKHDLLFLEVFRDDIVAGNTAGLPYAWSKSQGQALESCLVALKKVHADLESPHAKRSKEVGDLRNSDALPNALSPPLAYT